MPDRTDPRNSPANGPRVDVSTPESDDPLAALTRIVTGRTSSFAAAARAPASAERRPADQGSAASTLGDLEAELMNDLQASFAAIRDSEPVPVAQAPSKGPAARALHEAGSSSDASEQPAEEQNSYETGDVVDPEDLFFVDEEADDAYSREFPEPDFSAVADEDAFVPPPPERPRSAASRYQPQPPRESVFENEVEDSLQLRPSADFDDQADTGAGEATAADEFSSPLHSRWEDTSATKAAAAAGGGFAPRRDDNDSQDTSDDELFRDGGIFGAPLSGAADAGAPAPASLAPDYQRDEELPSFAEDDEYGDEKPSRRGNSRLPFLVAGVIGIVVVGGIAVATLRPQDGGGPPPVIAASTDPARITPEETGGEDQNKQSYDRINSSDTSTDTTLLTPRTDVVDVVNNDDSPISRVIIPAGPGYDQPGAEGTGGVPDDIGALAGNDATEAPLELGPRRVRTVVVKPDGTIVESASAEAGAEPPVLPSASGAAPAAQAPEAAPRPVTDDTAAIAGMNSDGELAITPNATIDDLTAAPAPQPPVAQDVPVVLAPPASSAQPAPPVQAPQQTAAGGVLVQVSSQRSEEAALATFRDLQARYPSILGQYQPDLQRADIADRGTFYRVRVGPFSSGDAQRLCSDLKSAGGDCIIAQR